MSTWLYLQCLDHNPPLLADEESGQHLADLPQIFDDLADRPRAIARMESEMPIGYFQVHTARFLAKHFRCRITVIDEYGDEHRDTRQ